MTCSRDDWTLDLSPYLQSSATSTLTLLLATAPAN